MGSEMCIRDRLRENLPDVKKEVVDSAEQGLSRVREQKGAAIIHQLQSEHVSGLQVLADKINNNPEGSARFLVIGSQEPVPSPEDKTSIICVVEERAGALFDVLGFFAKRDVTLSKIESKPRAGAKSEYVFFIDLIGNRAEPALADSISELESSCKLLKVLGSYPQGVKPQAENQKA